MGSCPICLEGEGELFCSLPDQRGATKRWEVWRCRCCEHGWTFPLLSPEETSLYYPPAYLGNTRKRLEDFRSGSLQKTRSWTNEKEKARLLKKYADRGRILDVGCADASFLLALDGASWERSGVEYIGEVVDLVNSYFPELEVHHGEIYQPSLQPGSYDVVTLWHVLEHLTDPHRVARRLCELVRPGGWLLIAVPRFDSHQARLFRSHWFALDVPRHQHHYSARSLHQLLQDNGFIVENCVFFSRKTSAHQVKHSLLKWSEARWGNRLPYYLLKPFALASTFLEGWLSQYSALACLARRPD